MDTLPLPPRPNLDQYKKRAKDLVAATRSIDPKAVRAWATDWLEALAKSLGVTSTRPYQDALDRAIASLAEAVGERLTALRAKGGQFALADAQLLIASAHGFANWPAFAHHVQPKSRAHGEGQEFEAAVDAVVSGDLAALELLVRSHPDLIRARSTRVHHCTLLHYVAANGVEDYRQRTPPNAVAIARLLLESGADVDAVADTYGGGTIQTTMNLLVSSAHPAGAGLQSAMAEVLLDFGAAINGVANDDSPLFTALRFGYGSTAETLARRGARVDNVVTAAALGRLDLVRTFVVDKNTLEPNAQPAAPQWAHLPMGAKALIELALAWACKFGRTEVADFLLDSGVDPASSDSDHMTALHWAAANRSIDLVKDLLRRGAPLEVENAWGGTVLNSTLHFALYIPIEPPRPPPENSYPAVIETLIGAGADVHVAGPYPSGDAAIDEVLRRHGAR